MKRFAIVIFSCALLAACGGGTEETAPEPEPEAPAPGPPRPSHPEIMQEISQTRPALLEDIEAGNAAAAAAAAARLEELFNETIPIYEERGLPDAVQRATGAAAAAAEAATAAEANDMEAATTAHGMIQKACGGCHEQHREKAPDGSYQFKTQ